MRSYAGMLEGRLINWISEFWITRCSNRMVLDCDSASATALSSMIHVVIIWYWPRLELSILL